MENKHLKQRQYLSVDVHHHDGSVRENDLTLRETHLITKLLKQEGVDHVTISLDTISQAQYESKFI